ncbi:hypothetical protein UFOVP964_67 [uncultured Caudovirales phage]|uniref:Uncharacterized protein n=1 Tax=uncultured Caudovirales phage TaxID=2100421 RepID=A0A6J5R927_9CAUD|nr:hypothetical protein UFOVP854_67 [uncultured Caudovirales phage]CAB4174623.1 hypothetical protein UFOVP964_67 [uncultured Caudovirales phage]CAB4179391.1 hypothetical protein UFOVP1034_91 [uncultured Caudovirales phage]CAB4189135.1 hypothetical protein UFOVP1177_91 [uncultured Caudovirales phage]CAB4193431.1 hypothetical protein UFOVP1243_78 [uncultured Caudovirales phage]
MSKEDNFPHFVEYSPKEAGHFKAFIQRAKKASPMGAAVDVHKVADYKKMRMFSTPDGQAGYAVNSSGELNSVFKHPDSKYKDVARHAAEHAVLMAKATHASAFDPKLPEMYQKGGLRALSHVQWNEDYKPQKWSTRRQGRPAVAFLGADRSVAREANSGDTYKPGSTPEVKDYDTGMAKAKKHGENKK